MSIVTMVPKRGCSCPYRAMEASAKQEIAGLHLKVPQSQRIRDHRHGTEAHGRSGQDRA
jgi:hypothetical protein